jgi:hypothetical protein
VLTPQNCQIIFIDHQPQMVFGVQSIDRQVLKNNTVAQGAVYTSHEINGPSLAHAILTTDELLAAPQAALLEHGEV